MSLPVTVRVALRRTEGALLRVVARLVPVRAQRGRALLAHLPTYLPDTRAGSEVSMATTLARFVEEGWKVTALVDQDGEDTVLDGVQVIRAPGLRRTVALYRSADVVFTQLGSRNRAARLAALTRRPLVLFLRMGGLDERRLALQPSLVVFNAEWLRRASSWDGPSAVLHPPVNPERYRTTPGDAVTLVNLSVRKGGDVFWDLASRLPEVPFLGVRGHWGDQVERGPLPNVQILDPVADMREVYSRTRLLLMPSEQEPYGRVGLEASVSGIPVVASDLPGIREALGEAGVYVGSTATKDWLDVVARLMEDPNAWGERSESVKRRAAEVSSRDEVSRLIELVAGMGP
jgi:glycosyltransferase involved in cell wall biosynthesis